MTAWRQVLGELTPTPTPTPTPLGAARSSSILPARLAADLVNALAALALAGT